MSFRYSQIKQNLKLKKPAIMPENGVNLEFIVILKNKDDIQKIEWNDKVENTLKKVFKKTKASALHRGVGIIKFTDNITKLE